MKEEEEEKEEVSRGHRLQGDEGGGEEGGNIEAILQGCEGEEEEEEVLR